MNLSIPPLYNTEIDSFLLNYDLPYYLGVFSSNNIPKLSKKCVLICNLSNDYQMGTHFVTICRIKNEIMVLDPLALNIANEILLNKLKSITNTFTHLTAPIQSFESRSCGLFCIFFVLLFHKNCSTSIARHGIIQFTTDPAQLNKNDIICIKNIKLLLGMAG